MKCGNCKQDHPTVADVKACYAWSEPDSDQTGFTHPSLEAPKHPDAAQLRLPMDGMPERTPVPDELRHDSRLATDKQLSYLKRLVAEKDWPTAGQSEAEARYIATCENVLEGKAITFDEAKFTISYLVARPTKLQEKFKDVKPDHSGDHAIEVGCVPAQGTYTVVIGSERRTLKFVAPKQGSFKGMIVVRFLSGRDNEEDYTGFANSIDNTHVRVWRRFKEDSLLIDCLKFLCESDTNRADAGERYALESSKCWRCGRKLTVPASIHRGLGPECAKQVEL